MKKTLLISKNIKEKNMRLDYYIIQERYIDISNNISTYVYGVEIRRSTGGDTENTVRRTIRDISCNEKIIAEFIHTLCENDVLPEHLYDIVSEKIDENYFVEKERELMQA